MGSWTRLPFVDDMINVRCIAFVDDGVLVVESEALWLCKDNDGDLRCDEREKLIGFCFSAHSNIEHAENALHYALDNWMYNSKSSRKLAWRRGKLIEMPAKGRGQWGMASDAYGRLYFNANSNWFEVDWATYDRQWPSKSSTVKAPTNRVYGIRPNTALESKLSPRENLGRRSRGQCDLSVVWRYTVTVPTVKIGKVPSSRCLREQIPLEPFFLKNLSPASDKFVTSTLSRCNLEREEFLL